MDEERRDRQEDLLRTMAKYLRELRIESGDLYARLDTLEKELGKELKKEREYERLEYIPDIVAWAEESTGPAQPSGFTGPAQPSGFTGSVQPSGFTGSAQPSGFADPSGVPFTREPGAEPRPSAPMPDDDELELLLQQDEPEPPAPEAETTPEAPQQAPARTGKRTAQSQGSVGRKIVRVVGNVFFCVALAALLVGAYLIRSTQEGAPFRLAGFSGMLVLSGSMQDVIPKGSFILTRSVEPSSLKVGDDITYMLNATTTVTHRIIDIRPQSDGSLAFQTKGVNNTTPDSALVASANVVGKVIYHSYTIGLAAETIRDNWPLLLFLTAVFMILCRVLAYIQRDDDSQSKKKSRKKGKTAGARAA